MFVYQESLLPPKKRNEELMKRFVYHSSICEKKSVVVVPNTLMEDHGGTVKKSRLQNAGTCSITSCCTTEGTPQQGRFGLAKHLGYIKLLQ